MFLGKPT